MTVAKRTAKKLVIKCRMKQELFCSSVSDIKDFTDSQLLSIVTGISEEKSDSLTEDGLDVLLGNAGNLDAVYGLALADANKIEDFLQFAKLLDKAEPDTTLYRSAEDILKMLFREGQLQGSTDKFILVIWSGRLITSYKVFDAVDSMEMLPKAEIVRACGLQGAQAVSMVHYRTREDLQPNYDDRFLQQLAVNLLGSLHIDLFNHIITNGNAYQLVEVEKDKSKSSTQKGDSKPEDKGYLSIDDISPKQGFVKKGLVDTSAEPAENQIAAAHLSRICGISEMKAQRLCHNGLFYLRAKADIIRLLYDDITPEEFYRVLCTLELANRVAVSEVVGTKYTGLEQIFKLLRSEYLGKCQEHSFIVMLDQDKEIIGYKLMCIGDTGEVEYAPTVIIKECLKYNARYLIHVHTHPNGDLKASDPDYICDAKLTKVLSLLDIKLLDSLVLTDYGYHSEKVVNID